MSEWPRVPLADLLADGKVSYGIVQPGGHAADGIPIIRVQDMSNGRIRTDHLLSVAPEISEKHRKTVLSGGEVLISIVGSIGEVAVVPPECAGWNVARAIAVMRPRGVTADWLCLALTTAEARNAIDGMLNTTVQATLNLADLKRIPIPVPPEPVRGAIAEVLGALDDKIAANDRSLDIMHDLARAMVLELPTSSEATLSEISSMIVRGVAPRYVENDGLMVLNQKCIRDHRVDLAPARMTESSVQSARKLLRNSDLLVNSTGQGTLGRVARWVVEGIEATVDSHVTIVRFDPTKVDITFAGVRALELEDRIAGLAEGSTGQTELKRDLLGAIEVGLPALDAQRTIGERVRAFDALSESYRTESRRLVETRDQLLPLLMSGRIRVKDAEKTVETVL